VSRGDDHSGSTAITALVTPTHFFIGNCGDSRAILVRAGAAVELSQDHKPYLPAETARIEAAGGTVAMRRVNGDLAVSRALGDFVYKQSRDLIAEKQQVSVEPVSGKSKGRKGNRFGKWGLGGCSATSRSRPATPNLTRPSLSLSPPSTPPLQEIRIVARDPSADQFLVLACDGIWDVLTNDDVAAFVLARTHEGVDNIGVLAETLIDEGLARNSRDNMSAVIVAMPAAPRPTPDLIEAYRVRAAADKARADAAAAAGGNMNDGDDDEEQ
jgi:protein phosphatase 1B